MARDEPTHTIIHIGPHKTGTTSIQAMLSSLSRREDRPFAYPFCAEGETGQHTFAHLACDPEQPAFAAMLAELAAMEGLCILSSEELCYLPAAGLRNLHDARPGARATIVYYQRDLLALLQSWWQETIKHGSVQPLASFALDRVLAPHHLHLLVPDALLSGWASVFGREVIRIFRYEHISDVAQHFASEFLGVDLPAEASAVSNRSYDPIDCEMMRLWNLQGFWGAGVVQAPGYRELRAAFIERSGAFERTFSLDYTRSAFSAIEDALISRWGDRIEGFDGGALFETRERTFAYIDPDIWAANPDLIGAIRAFAVQHPAYSRPR